MNVLVTGGAGFLGSHLCEALLARGHKVSAVDNLSTGTKDNLSACLNQPLFQFSALDILDAEALLAHARAFAPQVVVHLAASKIPRYGSRIQTCRVNSIGTFNVFEASRECKSHTVMASTSDVYGKNPNVPFTEQHDCVLGPSAVARWSYSTTKMLGEHVGYAYHEEYGLPVSLIRLFGSYGPRHHRSWWGGPQSVFIDAVLNNQMIDIHGDGQQTRSFCFVSDTVDGFMRAIERPADNCELFNIGNDEEISILDLAKLIKELSLTPGELQMRLLPYSTFGKYEDVLRRVPNLEKSAKVLGFRPQVTLREGLRRTIEWHKENPHS